MSGEVNRASTPLADQLRIILNAHSVDNESNTPDFILAYYMLDCLDAFSKATKRRDHWYGRTTDAA